MLLAPRVRLYRFFFCFQNIWKRNPGSIVVVRTASYLARCLGGDCLKIMGFTRGVLMVKFSGARDDGFGMRVLSMLS